MKVSTIVVIYVINVVASQIVHLVTTVSFAPMTSAGYVFMARRAIPIIAFHGV